MSNAVQLKSMSKKLNEMNRFLGGKDFIRPKRGNNDFQIFKNEFLERRHEADKYLFERDDPKADKSRAVRLNHKIRQCIISMTTLHDKMLSEVRNGISKKIPSETRQKQQKIVDNCRVLLDDLKDRHTGYANRGVPAMKVQTLTDLRMQLLKEIDTKSNEIKRIDNETYGPDEEEIEAMRQFKETDRQLDGKLDLIIKGVDGVLHKVRNINAANDQVADRIKKNRKAVDSLSQHIETENEKLKKILKKFKPFNVCLWISLLLSIAGLVVIIINLSK